MARRDGAPHGGDVAARVDRRSEWFVPAYGPERFRVAVGLLFLPYTAMVLGFTVIGSMLAPAIHWDRVAAIVLIYFVAAYAIGIWYMVRYTPLLWLIAIPEGFFLLAYNLEWFGGRFHRDSWFALSWGALPVLAGYILQTNAISISAVAVAVAMALFSLIEIRASRPYKELRR